MQIFVLCCLSLILLADVAYTSSDTEDLADELLDAVLDKKSDTNDSAVDGDKRDKHYLDLKIIEDILSGDKQSLQEDLQERQEDNDFQNFLTAVGLATAEILRGATQNVGGDIVYLLHHVDNYLRGSRRERFICRLSRRERPRWLGLLKEVFQEVDQYLDEQYHC